MGYIRFYRPNVPYLPYLGCLRIKRAGRRIASHVSIEREEQLSPRVSDSHGNLQTSFSIITLHDSFFENQLVPVGGKRPGAGRKPGDAWHGKPARPKVIRDMAKARVREVLATSRDPLAVLIEIANDPGVDVQIRVQAATSCAPYMFPRLSATVVATAPMSARDDTVHLVERLMQRFTRLVPPAAPEAGAVIEGEPIATGPSTVAA